MEESLLDNLLKSRYPLTHYLYRQQEFIKTFSTAPITTVTTPTDPETNVSRKQKTPLPSYYNVPYTIDPKAPKFKDRRSDRDDNTSHEQSSEIDDESA